MRYFAVIAEYFIELNTKSSKLIDAEGRICREYSFKNPAASSDIQLIAFRKFNGRFSAFVMISNSYGLAKLVKKYFDNKLKEFLERAIASIVRGVRIKRINWSVKGFSRCSEYFQVRRRRTSSSGSTPSPSPQSQSFPTINFGQITLGIVTFV